MSDTYSTLLIDRRDEGYVIVTLNRPEALNALNSTLFGELAAFLDSVETDDVRKLFETARTPKGDYAFTQPMLMNVYLKA